ncbi:MAG: hypothetical protein ACYDCK_15260 [Thermoplasmatota archaeon]
MSDADARRDLTSICPDCRYPWWQSVTVAEKALVEAERASIHGAEFCRNRREHFARSPGASEAMRP